MTAAEFPKTRHVKLAVLLGSSVLRTAGIVQASIRVYSPRRGPSTGAHVGGLMCSNLGRKGHCYELCTSRSSPIALAQLLTHNLRDELQWQVFHPVVLPVFVSAVFSANTASTPYQGSVTATTHCKTCSAAAKSTQPYKSHQDVRPSPGWK